MTRREELIEIIKQIDVYEEFFPLKSAEVIKAINEEIIDVGEFDTGHIGLISETGGIGVFLTRLVRAYRAARELVEMED